MKQVVDVEDLFWFVEKYKEYYKEHNGRRYLDPAGLLCYSITQYEERIFY